jgi:CO/xanthine dehydrogenase FAD-binding subunit
VTATPASYLTATSVEEAVAAMAAGARPIAGGTDLVVGARHGEAPLPAALVGIHRIPALGTIDDLEYGTPQPGSDLRIGALVTHQAIVAHPGILARFTGLADASAIVGSHATRANGTLGGNVMNASPAMDTGAPLLCHGAVAVLHGPGGVRRVALDDLWTAPGRVSAVPSELLVAVELPAPRPGTGSAYVRLQYRRQMEIAIVGVAAVVTVVDGAVTDARIAIAALAPVIHRVPDAEAALIGAEVGTDAGADAVAAAGRLAADASRPISDVRGSADYRRAMAAVITRRAIVAALTRAGGGAIAVPASDSTYGS